MSNVYVYEQGAMLKYKENRLIINYSENDFKSIPIENIDNIVIFGAIQVSTKCVQQMLTRGVNLIILSNSFAFDALVNINIGDIIAPSFGHITSFGPFSGTILEKK